MSVVFEVRRALCFDQSFFEEGEVFPITGAFSFPGEGDCDSVLAPGLYGLDFQVSSSGQQSASWNLTAWLRYPIESNFDVAQSADGWDVVDLDCDTLNQIGSDVLHWFPTGGDPRGHVGAVDPSDQCFFFRAPSRFLGDQSAAAGSTLRFSVRTTADNYLPGSIVILRSGATRLVYDFGHPPVETWTRYAVPLNASAFRVGSAGGPPPSEQVFAAVLANLDGLFIGAEFGTPVFESSFLDRVAWGVPACAGDIDLDGDVDAADLARLLGAWGTSGPDEDLDGDGTVGPADLALVLGGWGDCPQ